MNHKVRNVQELYVSAEQLYKQGVTGGDSSADGIIRNLVQGIENLKQKHLLRVRNIVLLYIAFIKKHKRYVGEETARRAIEKIDEDENSNNLKKDLQEDKVKEEINNDIIQEKAKREKSNNSVILKSLNIITFAFGVCVKNTRKEQTYCNKSSISTVYMAESKEQTL